MRRTTRLSILLGCLLTPALSPAQEFDPGTSIEVGGGVSDFAQAEVGRLTGLAGAWMARAVFGTRTLAGLEVAYVGSVSAIDALGLDADAVLARNGVEACLRVGVPLAWGRWRALPFAFVGVGYAHYVVLSDRFATSSLKDDDDVLQAPLGVGLAFAVRRLALGARIAYYPTFDDELLRSAAGGADAGAGLDSWLVTVHVGVEP